MLVLAELDKDDIGTGLELHREPVLVNFHAPVVFIAAKNRFAIEPQFPGVFAAEAQFGGAGCRTVIGGGGVAGDFLQHAERFVEVDDAELTVAGPRLPAHHGILPGFDFLARIAGGQVDGLFRREDGFETRTAFVVEGPDHLPIHEESEVPGKIDGFPEGAEFVGGGPDLVFIARGFERLAEFGFVLGGGGFGGEAGNGFAAQGGDGVEQQAGNQGIPRRPVGLLEEVGGEQTASGAVGGVFQEIGKEPRRQGLACGGGAVGHGKNGPAEPIGCEGIGLIHGSEKSREVRRSRGGGKGLPSGGGFGIALAFGADGEEPGEVGRSRRRGLGQGETEEQEKKRTAHDVGGYGAGNRELAESCDERLGKGVIPELGVCFYGGLILGEAMTFRTTKIRAQTLKLAGLALGWAWIGVAAAQSTGLEGLKKSYEAEVARTVLPLREGYHKALLALEQQLASKGDYAGARRVQAERLELDGLRGRPPGTAASSSKMVDKNGVVKLGLPAESGGGIQATAGAWTGWQVAGGFVKWGLPAGLPSGGYAVELVYDSAGEGSLRLGVREDFHFLNREVKVPATAPAGVPQGRLRLGTLRLRSGATLLELKLTAPTTVAGFRLFELQLIPEETQP